MLRSSGDRIGDRRPAEKTCAILRFGHPRDAEPMATTEFREKIDRAPLDAAMLALLPRRISDLELRIAGTRLEGLVARLYADLEAGGLVFRPKCYLADEWGCPTGVPVIGIPFYLADPQLSRIEGELTGIEAESDAEILMYLRHEAGHAFSYAYRLYLEPDWTRTFGSFRRPYPEEYRPDPFSDRFVRHIPGWYAQRHPDEDFAETFAVWVTPEIDWRALYAGTPAMDKLLYVDRVTRLYGKQPPAVTDDYLDEPVERLRETLAEWYSHLDQRGRRSLGLPRLIDTDLRRVFPASKGMSAESFMLAYRGRVIYEVNYWTGMDLDRLGELVDEIIERIRALGLRVAPGQESTTLIGIVALLTTLVMNYHYTNQFARR